jgi:hypothetical protein
MRIKSELWAKAYIRRCSVNGAPAVIARRGQSDGGAIFIKINKLDGQALIYGPAPAGLDASSSERRWSLCCGDEATGESEADNYLQRQAVFDPDIWVIEVEDRNGRHFLGESLASD